MDNKNLDNKKVAATAPGSEREYGIGYKLIGKNYATPDLYAKVTGQAKYAEDFRAEGMLFCKLLLSPMPHARVKRIHMKAALAMPGVRGILTADGGLLARPQPSRRVAECSTPTTSRTR